MAKRYLLDAIIRVSNFCLGSTKGMPFGVLILLTATNNMKEEIEIYFTGVPNTKTHTNK